MSPIGIAIGVVGPATCGMARVGAVEDDEFVFEFDVAEVVIFKLGEVEFEVSGFLELKTFKLVMDRFEVKLDSADRTSRAAFVADATAAGDATGVAGLIGLISTRFWPTEVVLNYKYYDQMSVNSH